MKVKYVLSKEEGFVNGRVKLRPVIEFDTVQEANNALRKVKSGNYSVVPMIIE